MGYRNFSFCYQMLWGAKAGPKGLQEKKWSRAASLRAKASSVFDPLYAEKSYRNKRFSQNSLLTKKIPT